MFFERRVLGGQRLVGRVILSELRPQSLRAGNVLVQQRFQLVQLGLLLNGLVSFRIAMICSFIRFRWTASLNTRGGMWLRPVSLALSPRSKSGYFLTICSQNLSCYCVSFFLLPTISLALSRPSSVSGTKQRYNTLDFPTENRVPTGMLRAPIGNPASKGIFPSELPIFSSQTGTQTVKTQFGTPAQKMQKKVRTDEWRTSFFADNLKSLRYSFRLSASARGHDA